MSSRSTLRIALAIGLATAGTAAPVAAHAVDTTSPVVISEVFGGGGNTGAPYRSDFIELYNASDAPVSLEGWSVQYASATGTTWQRTALTGTIAPRSTFVVKEADGASTTAPALPKVDVAGTIAMSGAGARVALVRSAAALTCGADCDGAADVVDYVGWGGAGDYVVAAAPATTNSTSISRALPVGTAWDNSKDYSVGAPTPGAVTAGTGPVDPGPVDTTPGPLTIQDIQGPGFVSPVKGQAVTNVPGIVTAVRATGRTKGFWIQQPEKDPSKANASTGVFVFTASAPITVKAGDSVLVSGTVSDYYTLASGETLATTDALSMTEITKPVVNVLSSGNPLPAALRLPADMPSTYAPTGAPDGNIENLTLDPSRSALEWYESHEGEMVAVDDARVVGPGQQQYGEIYVQTKPEELRTPRGGTYIADSFRTPTGRMLVMPVDGKVPAANVGDVLAGTTQGPVDWSTYGGYTIAATQLGSHVDKGLQRTVVDAARADQMTVATYNVENLAPSDPQTKFDALAQGIVTNLRSPDVITVEEIQDDSGATNDGVVTAGRTVSKLLDAVRAAGGPAYEAAWVDPADGQDGGQPGGNIRVALFYNPARVTFVSRPGGSATTATTVTKDTTPGLVDTPALSASPGRVDPTNPAWNNSRKPLAGEFVFQGRKVVVVANHFNSKGGDESADGRFQPPNRTSEVQRTQQARSLRAFVEQIKAVDPQANVVLGGDFNDYQFSAPMKELTGDGSVVFDTMWSLPENERYSYIFNGISQTLDHLMVTPNLKDATQLQVAHINAEFAVQNSDHDPQVIRTVPALHLYAPGTATLVADKRKPGQLVEVNLAGWTPGDVVTVTLGGKVVGTVTIGDAGTAYFAYRVPTTTTAGKYALVLTGRQTLPQTMSFTVVPKKG